MAKKFGPAKKKAVRKKSTRLVPVSSGRGEAVKTAAQIRALKKRFAISGGTGPLGQCWFKDTGGGDQCIPATQADCTAEGGNWNVGNCPNG
jgi:hypothetical protein